MKFRTTNWSSFNLTNGTVQHVSRYGPRYWQPPVKVFRLSFSNLIAWYTGVIPKQVKRKLNDNPFNLHLCLASYDASQSTLSKFSELFKHYKGHPRDFTDIVLTKCHRLHFPKKLLGPNVDDILLARIKESTHPGGVTRELFSQRTHMRKHLITKGNVVLDTFTDVRLSWHKISSGHWCNGSHFVFGSREKINVSDIGSEIKSRPLFIPETFDQMYSSTWLEYFKANWSDDQRLKSELWIGHSDEHQGWYKRLELYEKFKYSYETDGKSNDARLRSEIQFNSFALLSSCFQRSGMNDNHLRFLWNNFHNTFYSNKNGDTFHIRHGTLTGHTLTSIMNTISVWSIWTYTINKFYWFKENVGDDYELCIQGDDMQLFCNILIPKHIWTEVSKFISENLHYEIDVVDIDPVNNQHNDDLNKSSFLRKIICCDNLQTRPWDLFEKLLFGPEISGERSNRFRYLSHRFNNIVNDTRHGLRQITRYCALIYFFSKNEDYCEWIYKSHFKLLINNNINDAMKLKYVLSLFDVTVQQFNDKVDEIQSRILLNQQKIVNTFSTDYKYSDYWEHSETARTVEDILQKPRDTQLLSGISFFDHWYLK